MIPKDSPSKYSYLFFIILIHACWFIGALIWKHTHNGDTEDYIFLAENLKKGFYYCGNPHLPIDDFLLSSRPPLYSLMIMVSYAIFGVSDWPVLVLQNVASIASCWMILSLFERLMPKRNQNLIFVLFLLFYPAQMCFASLMSPDIFLQFFLVLYIRELMISFKQPSKRSMIKMSLWLVLATLLKPVVYPFLILHVIYSVWYYIKTKIPTMVLLGMLPIMMIMGYGYWNQSRTGLYHISSIQSKNLLNANVRDFLIFKYGQTYADSTLNDINKRVAAQTGLKRKYELADKEASIIIKENLLTYSFYHVKESARFFVAPGKYDLDVFVGLYSDNFQSLKPNFYKSYQSAGLRGIVDYFRAYPLLPVIILVILFNVIRIIGWVLFLCDKQYSLTMKIFSSIYIIYFAVVTGPVANARYFLPVFLFMSAFSALGIAGFIDKRKKIIISP